LIDVDLNHTEFIYCDFETTLFTLSDTLF